MPEMQSKAARLLLTDEVCVLLAYYPAGLHMAAHEHESHQISYLLAGHLNETVSRNEATICAPSIGVKHAGVLHKTEVGPNGALILSFNVQASVPMEALPQNAWAWHNRTAAPEIPNGREMIHTMCDPNTDPDLVWDFILGAEIQKPNGSDAPSWLGRAKEQICDEPIEVEMSEVAKTHGVHPGHFSRAFKKHFGVSPSRFRTHMKLLRGLGQLIDGQRPAQAAIASGFADQAHFTRATEREFGVTPGRFASLFAA